jgi:hypothetical protein
LVGESGFQQLELALPFGKLLFELFGFLEQRPPYPRRRPRGYRFA